MASLSRATRSVTAARLAALVFALAMSAALGMCVDQDATISAPPTPSRAGDLRPRASSAGALLETLPVASETANESYERDAFGGWAVGPDGCDTRDRVLVAESTAPVSVGADGCGVLSGRWVSLYDGYATTDPTELEVDHVVALAEAWASGAASWPPERREAYANDTDQLDALIAVTAATNRSKSDKDPAEWLPPDPGAWCRFAEAWVVEKASWDLTVDVAERDALRNVLARCPEG